MKPRSSRPFRIAVALLVVASLGWGGWVYEASREQTVVHRSAHQYYRANVASEHGVPIVAARDNANGYVPWTKLTSQQKHILAPLEKRWDYLSNYQRRSLVESARRYPKMTAEQQQRYRSRLVDWTRLTRKERMEVRQTYKQLAALPPDKQAEIEKAWFAQREPAEAEGELTPAALTAPDVEN
jgi:hypothetical protein